MTSPDIFAGAPTDRPIVRRISTADLREALAKGAVDFWEAPTHMVFLSLIYPVVGLLFGRLLIGADVTPMLFPFAAGLMLIGPFAAVGLYALSRRRERGLPISWLDAVDVWHSPSRSALLALGAILSVLFLAWMATAWALYRSLIGDAETESAAEYVTLLFSTRSGLILIVAGSLVGLVFAVLALAIGVVSIPLLLDRPVGVAVAVDISVRAVIANPSTMALWGLTVMIALAIGALPAFIGLSVVMPILAHATWHLYRRVIAT